MKPDSQCQIILDHMREYGYITALQCSDVYRITNLKGRIFDLRKKGHTIVNIDRINPRTKTNYAEYTLIE